MANPAHRRQGVSPQRAVSPLRAAPVAQYDPYAPQEGYLSENIHRLLTERECSIFDRGLADYHRRRNVRVFVECLSVVLNTNQKRQLLLPIRDTYIKPTDFTKFNQLVQTHGLATSLRKKKKDEEKSKDVRKLEIKRDPMEEWGFNIRGGAEHGLGIFVSWIDPGSAAQRAGLHAGDQILKANDLNCENVSHYEAVQLIKNVKKLRLWVLSHGRVPSSHMANKVYRWVDPDGRPTTPPPDPFEVQDQVSKGDRSLMSGADEKKVTIMVDNGQELGISIRGGAEHGLGVYISFIEEGSVAEAYGLKVGDQILEVNGVNFLGIVHSDAANALRAQPCMVMRVKDVGKLPHSRITTYGQTKWQAQSPTGSQKWSPQKNEPPSPAFRSGVGTQVMLKQDTSIQGKGMMDEVARSVLSTQEVATFNYYVHQYEHYNLPVDDLVTPLLDLFNTKEKLQLISEVRTIIKPQDLQQYNELTVHKEIAAKKAAKRNINGSIDDLVSKLSTQRSPKLPSSFNHLQDSGTIELHPITNGANGHGGRDTIPHKLSPQRPGGPVFHIPPPPASSQPTTSTPGGRNGSGSDETDHGQWNETSMMSSIQPPAGGNLTEIEARIRAETEAKLKQQFEEQQQKLLQEQQQRLAEEQREKEMTLSRERETLERKLKEMEQRVKAEMEEKERLLSEDSSRASHDDPAEIEERIKQELEEKIWREAEEHMREEFESKMEQEKQSLLSQQPAARPEVNEQEIADRVRKEVEGKLKREYQEKVRQEEQKWKRKEEEERRRRDEEQKQKREDEIKRLEAEEQARIELEERVRREAEAKARAEYEARLQHETEERARLAEEVKARKALEERMQKERTQQQHKEEEEEEDEEDLEEQQRLEEQRRQREREQREEERRMAQQRKAAEEERKKKEDERQKKLELQRKREENLRRKEQEKKQWEAEEKKRREEEARKQAQQQKAEAPPARRADPQPKTKDQIVADERRRAEEKLQRRLQRAQEQKKTEETDSGPPPRSQQRSQQPPARTQQPPPPAEPAANTGQSYAGYDNLHGTLLNITVTKVCKRLGIAIDGGANTKQKAVIIREISPGGCAAQTGLGMSVGQQILSVDGQSLYGLKHKDVVMTIKTAFEGPLNKTIDFAILEPEE